jgi:hypothetical protein
MNNATKGALITGVFVILAAVISTYKLSNKPKPDDLLITEIVVELDHNKEIGQALVTIVGRTEQATTRDNGNFRIVMPVVSPTVVTLRVTKPGYQPREQDVHVPVEGVTLQMRKQ